MNRRTFINGAFAVAGMAAMPRFALANEGEKKMKCAVVYFSWSGNTRFAAATIAKKAGADLFEIKSETPYNSDFHKCCDEAKPECYGKKLRPIKPIAGLDLAKYDVARSLRRNCRNIRRRVCADASRAGGFGRMFRRDGVLIGCSRMRGLRISSAARKFFLIIFFFPDLL